MILEHAVLPVVPDREADFEAAFAVARPLIEVQPGCLGVALHRSLEGQPVADVLGLNG